MVVAVDNRTVTINATGVTGVEIPDEMMRKMRSSIFLMGPLLSRFGEVKISKPGGCSIGVRPIDLHVKGLKALGAEIVESHGHIHCKATRLTGAEVYLDLPSVGATENIMMAAVLAKGTTTISNAAREPEITDLANFLKAMGARIFGAGEDAIVIEGVDRLSAAMYSPIPDRIVVGSLLIGAAITRGDVVVKGVIPSHLTAVLNKLRETGVEIETGHDIIRARMERRPNSIDRLHTAYYPGFPTDLQAPFMSLLSVCNGTSIISETVFEERFKHVSELQRMGAFIKVDLRTAFVRGVAELSGATVEATDLRAGAALVLAGLAACGRTVVEQVYHIDRGYESIESVLGDLGAQIVRL